MDARTLLREARDISGLTQAALAARAGTSQAAISAYESGRKQPSVSTLARLLASAGSQLAVAPRQRAVVLPARAELERRGRTLSEVLDLADALPSKPPPLRFPLLKDAISRR